MFILVMPRYDDVGIYGHYYFSRFKAVGENKSMGVATKENLLTLKDYFKKADTIIVSGHGDYFFTIGDDEKPFFDLSNLDLLKGKVCYFAICKTGEGLGRRIAEKGGSFIGFKKEFIWNISTKNPETDEIGRIFWKVLVSIGRDVLNGLKLQEIYENGHFYFDYVITEVHNSKLWGKRQIIENLSFNKENFVVFGTKDPVPQKWEYIF